MAFLVYYHFSRYRIERAQALVGVEVSVNRAYNYEIKRSNNNKYTTRNKQK